MNTQHWRGRNTDDVMGPAFWPATDMAWATFLASYAWDKAPAGPVDTDACLREGGFSTLDPFDFEETCQDLECVAVVDVGVELAIPVAILVRQEVDGTLLWWWELRSNERRRT